ncbi:MAG: helix-turn-helix transcriptional regulator [Haloarculaceae archaeon]
MPTCPDSLVDYVARSAVRENVLDALASDPATTRTLCASLADSESGIYAAVGELSDADLVERNGDDAWATTCLGDLVASTLARRRGIESLVDADAAYWRDHDATALPAPFCASLDVLADDAEVVRATDTDPGRVTRMLFDHMADAARFDGISPVYAPEFIDPMESAVENADRPPRVLVRDAVFEDVDDLATMESLSQFELRSADVTIGLTVTEDAALLSLPTADGRYDESTQLVATSAAARSWGRDLFEWYWRRGDPAP